MKACDPPSKAWRVVALAVAWPSMLVAWVLAALVAASAVSSMPQLGAAERSGSVVITSGTVDYRFEFGNQIQLLLPGEEIPLGGGVPGPGLIDGTIAWVFRAEIATLGGRPTSWNYTLSFTGIGAEFELQASQLLSLMLARRPSTELSVFRNDLLRGLKTSSGMDLRPHVDALYRTLFLAAVVTLPFPLARYFDVRRRLRKLAAANLCLWCRHQLLPEQIRCPECGELVISPFVAPDREAHPHPTQPSASSSSPT